MNPLAAIVSYERGLIKLLRIFNTRSMILFYILGRAVSGSFIFDIYFLYSLIVFIFTYGFASILNYEIDKKTDNINGKKLQSHSTNVYLLNRKSILLLCAIAPLTISIFDTTHVSLFVSLSLLACGLIYSHPSFRLSYTPWGKAVLMALTYTVIPSLYGYYHIGIPENYLIPLLGICLLYSSWTLFSDVPDIKGDKLAGKRTFAVMLGVEKLTVFSLLISCLSVIIIFLGLPNSVAGISFIVLPLLFLNLFLVVKTHLLQYVVVRRIGGYVLLSSVVFFIFCFI